MTSLLTDVSASVRSNLSRSVVVMELLPLLVDVIQPTLRPVIPQFIVSSVSTIKSLLLQ